MDLFLKRHQGRVSGSITGFYRPLFRGILRSICYVERLNYFMGNQRIPFKEFKALVEKFSAGVRKVSGGDRETCGATADFAWLPVGRTKRSWCRKSWNGTTSRKGWCVLACVEPCQSFALKRTPQSEYVA